VTKLLPPTVHVENKSVPIFKNPAAGDRCLVSLLDKYLSKLPCGTDVFYCRPLAKYVEDGPWYSKQPKGKHLLSDMVNNMCKDAKIDGHFTNHSLRASGATELFQHNIPERVIQEFTGINQ
jgi:integrase